MSYDLVILGGGPAGVAAASAAALRKKSVCLVSAPPFLGYGLEGAFKSKSMFEIARSHFAVRHRWHLDADGYQINVAALRAASEAGASALRDVHRGQLEKLGVEIVEGTGTFKDPNTIVVDGREVSGEKMLIATGTRPRILSFIECDRDRVMTSDEMVNVEESIASLLVLGAGVIGCEFASIFASFGTKVTLVDTKARIFSHDDEDISDVLQQSFSKMGIDVRANARCQSVKIDGDKVRTDLGDKGEVVTERALLAIGRSPNTGSLGLDNAGIELNDRGYIKTSDQMQTNAPHIYSAGDVGLRDNEHDLSLVHVGEAEGRGAVQHMFDDKAPLTTDYVPFIIFTLPMVAGAGLSEGEARKRYKDVRVGKWANVRNHRAHALQAPEGFVKLIVGPEGDDRVLGVRAVGEGVDTVAGQVSVMIQHELPYTHLLEATQAHPSLSESLQGAARIIAGEAPEYVEGEERA